MAQGDALPLEAGDGNDARVGEQHAPVPEVPELRRRQRQTVAESEVHGAHGGIGLHAGGQEGGQIGRPHWSEGHTEAACLLDPVGGNA